MPYKFRWPQDSYYKKYPAFLTAKINNVNYDHQSETYPLKF